MLKSIFEAITPENIKNIPIVQDAMDIFVALLEENSQLSTDIKKLYTIENDIIRVQLAKIFLKDLYENINKVDSNEQLYNRFKDFTPELREKYINVERLKDVTKNMSEDDYLVIKNFKENKGTFDALNYMYSIVKKNTDSTNYDEETFFELLEDELAPKYTFTLKGAVDKTLYQSVVAPIAQPLGFLLTEYINTVTVPIEDNFLFTYSFINKNLDVYDSTDNLIESFDFKIISDVKVQTAGNYIINQIYFDDGTFLDYNVSLGTLFYKQDNGENVAPTIIKSYNNFGKVYLNTEYDLRKSYQYDNVLRVKAMINMDLAEYYGFVVGDIQTIIGEGISVVGLEKEYFGGLSDVTRIYRLDIEGAVIDTEQV